jgi:predicted nuclease of predicted toxin-antitoxin system
MIGHDVIRIGTDLNIPDDTDILALSVREQRILVTHDQDFGELVFLHNLPAAEGIIQFRYEAMDPEEVAKRLQLIIDSGLYSFKGNFTTVDEKKVRQRPVG